MVRNKIWIDLIFFLFRSALIRRFYLPMIYRRCRDCQAMVLKPILSRISMNHHTHRPPCHVDPAHRHSKRAFWSANVKKVRDHMCNLTTRTSENRQCNNANNIVRDIYMQWRCSRFYWPFYEQHEQTHYSGIPTHNNIIHRSMSSWSGSRKKIIRFCPSIYTRRWHIHCSAICVACGGPKKENQWNVR